MKADVTVAELAEWCESNDPDLSDDAAERCFFLPVYLIFYILCWSELF